jgi:tRNA threonylcarbamoyladenosine biosynthesis protein TsaB
LHLAGVSARDLQLLVVASGPGAFTGLRIGLAAIQGLAMVLATPTIAVSALDALALAARQAHKPGALPIAAWMDAQRGEVFAARYSLAAAEDDVAPVEAPWVAMPERVLAAFCEAASTTMLFIGNGATRYREEIAGHTHGAGLVVESPAALAPFLAVLGQRRAVRGEAGPPHALQPLYVRRPDAELERARRT